MNKPIVIPDEAIEAAAGWYCGACGKHEAPEMTAAEKAVQDIRALLDGYSKEWRREIDVVMDLHRIVGRYDVERIGATK